MLYCLTEASYRKWDLDIVTIVRKGTHYRPDNMSEIKKVSMRRAYVWEGE